MVTADVRGRVRGSAVGHGVPPFAVNAKLPVANQPFNQPPTDVRGKTEQALGLFDGEAQTWHLAELRQDALRQQIAAGLVPALGDAVANDRVRRPLITTLNAAVRMTCGLHTSQSIDLRDAQGKRNRGAS
jgi:hypothetical protein